MAHTNTPNNEIALETMSCSSRFKETHTNKLINNIMSLTEGELCDVISVDDEDSDTGIFYRGYWSRAVQDVDVAGHNHELCENFCSRIEHASSNIQLTLLKRLMFGLAQYAPTDKVEALFEQELNEIIVESLCLEMTN